MTMKLHARVSSIELESQSAFYSEAAAYAADVTPKPRPSVTTLSLDFTGDFEGRCWVKLPVEETRTFHCGDVVVITLEKP